SRTALVKVDPKSTHRTRVMAVARGSGREVSARALGQRAVEVVDQVLGVLDAGRQAHQVSGYLQLGPAHRGVRHPCWVLDQRLDATEALTQGPDLRRATDLACLLLTAPDLERDHAAAALHLPGRHVVAGVCGQPRIVDGRARAVSQQELHALLGVVTVAVHAHPEGL